MTHRINDICEEVKQLNMKLKGLRDRTLTARINDNLAIEFYHSTDGNVCIKSVLWQPGLLQKPVIKYKAQIHQSELRLLYMRLLKQEIERRTLV